MDNKAIKIIEFLKEIDKLKIVERKTMISSGRYENSAEHSWHIAMFIILFEKYIPKDLDILKCLKIALIHDLAEIYIGDVSAFDIKKRKKVKPKEREAAKKLFSMLPKESSKDYFDLFLDYENLKSKESRFVNSFDKLQPLITGICSNGEQWKRDNVNLDKLNKFKKKHMEHNDFMMEIYEKLIEDAKEKGYL